MKQYRKALKKVATVSPLFFLLPKVTKIEIPWVFFHALPVFKWLYLDIKGLIFYLPYQT